ncbi:unnamed protein product [Rhizopus stolonifer]
MIIEFIKGLLGEIILQPKISVLTACFIVLATLLYTLVQKYNRPPPHLAHLPYISLFTFLRYGFKDEPYEKYVKENIVPLLTPESGGIYAAPTIQRWVIKLADPKPIKQFTMKQEYILPKAESNAGEKGSLIHKFIGGPNILLLSGKEWRKHRKIANMAFIQAMPVKLFGRLANKMLKNMDIDCKEPMDVNDLFRRFAIDSIGIAGFGFDLHAIDDKKSEWVTYYESIMKGMAHPFFIVFPIFDTKYVHWFSKRKQLHDYMSKFLGKIDAMIEEKRQLVLENVGKESNEEKDLLTLMIESEMKEGEGLTNEELRADLCIFFLAGHDTTASALATTIYELARDKDIQDKAREEAIGILGDGPEEVSPTLDQLKEFTYINMVIKENLRRHPPAYVTTDRTSQEDLVLGNVHIPKGSDICFDIHSLQHNHNVWSRPFEFDPERFRSGGEADSLNNLSWAPFSSGSRHCVGMNFSLVEQRVAISLLCKSFIVEKQPSKKKI